MPHYKPLYRPAIGLSICKGEMFTMYLRRVRAVSNHNLSPKAWLSPSRMRPVIELLRDDVGSVDDVVSGCTPLPLAARFLPHDDFEFLKAHFLGDPQDGLQAKLGMNGPRSGWAKVRLLRCPMCLKEDVGSCGNPFWRRDNLIPGLLFCGRHQVPLHEVCGDCMDYECNPMRTLHAGYHCGCGLRPVEETVKMSDEHAEAQIELSTIASKLLDSSYLPNLNHDGVAAATAQAALAHGLVRDGRLRKQAALDFLNGHPLAPALKRTGFFIAGKEALGKVMKGETTLRHPVEAILLLRLLHNDWAHVEEFFDSKLQSPMTWRCPGTPARAEPSSYRSHCRKLRRQRNFNEKFSHFLPRYTEARGQHPELNHTQLLRLLPDEARLVLTKSRLSKAGYDVPISTPRRMCLPKEDLDKELADHVTRRGQQLRRDNYLKRITQRVLLRGSSRPGAFSSSTLAQFLLLTRAAIDEWSEDGRQWKVRISAVTVPTDHRQGRSIHGRAGTNPSVGGQS